MKQAAADNFEAPLGRRLFSRLTPSERNWELIHRLAPLTRWLRSYDWRKRLHKDIIAGIAVSFLQVPQAFAYAQVTTLLWPMHAL